jgi:hypothetical protein
VKIALRTIQALGRVITGDGEMSPYRSGPRLVDFFNEHGGNTIYGQGFPSRWQFTEEQLQKLNGTNLIREVIKDALDPRHYLETEYDAYVAVEHLNKYLVYDGFEIVKDGLYQRIRAKSSHSITAPNFVNKFSAQKGSHAFILEQSDKCREKLGAKDYDGAITNARSMVEAVFEEILRRKCQDIPDHEGDLNKLYKAIKKQLNLEPGQNDLTETLKQMLSGLNSIVTGIAGISNKMGDRHARKYKPAKHHAILAINTAYALCEFLLSSLEYQEKSEKIKGVENA